MKIASISQFNNWSEKDKFWWIDFETAGKYRRMKRNKGYFPIIIYQREDVAIVYKVDPKGKLLEAKAMTVKEAFQKLELFEIVSKALSKQN